MSVIQNLKGGIVLFWCPACKQYHSINIKKSKDKPFWDFNEDCRKPTIRPSILVTNPQGLRCHSFITDGRIKYLPDCKHRYAGREIIMRVE